MVADATGVVRLGLLVQADMIHVDLDPSAVLPVVRHHQLGRQLVEEHRTVAAGVPARPKNAPCDGKPVWADLCHVGHDLDEVDARAEEPEGGRVGPLPISEPPWCHELLCQLSHALIVARK